MVYSRVQTFIEGSENDDVWYVQKYSEEVEYGNIFESHSLINILRVSRVGTWLTVYRPLHILSLFLEWNLPAPSAIARPQTGSRYFIILATCCSAIPVLLLAITKSRGGNHRPSEQSKDFPLERVAGSILDGDSTCEGVDLSPPWASKVSGQNYWRWEELQSMLQINNQKTSSH